MDGAMVLLKEARRLGIDDAKLIRMISEASVKIDIGRVTNIKNERGKHRIIQWRGVIHNG
jgi:hypothetical protein